MSEPDATSPAGCVGDMSVGEMAWVFPQAVHVDVNGVAFILLTADRYRGVQAWKLPALHIECKQDGFHARLFGVCSWAKSDLPAFEMKFYTKLASFKHLADDSVSNEH